MQQEFAADLHLTEEILFSGAVLAPAASIYNPNYR
jgi:hypothetical protein